MKTINCQKCGNPVKIDLKESVTEDGEAFRCKYCDFIFRYVEE